MSERYAIDRVPIADRHLACEGGFAEAVGPDARLAEIFGESGDAAAIGFALAQIQRAGTLLWVQDRLVVRDLGRPYLLAHGRVIHVEARDAKDALWAMEEGLRCPELSAVIGEIAGDPRQLDFTASRRLASASERHGVPAFLVRLNASPNLSGARLRWRIASRPSAPHPWNDQAPGDAIWSAELFRARGIKPARWDIRHDSAANRLDLVSPDGDRALEPCVSRAA